MVPHIWELHAAVCELAHARALREFEVNYSDTGDQVEISLTFSSANDAFSIEQEPYVASVDTLC
jgi:hypothetical protein